MPSRQLPMSSTGSSLSELWEQMFNASGPYSWNPLSLKEINRIMYEFGRNKSMYTKPEDFPKTVTVNGHGTISSYNLPGVKVAQQIEHANAGVNRDLCPNKNRVAVYALIKVIEPEKDLTDWDPKDKKYYWTNAEGVRRPIKDLDTEHLKGILEMPDFKNSRLTAEMRHAIREELYRRTIQTARYKV